MKKLLAFILALGMVLALAACSGKDGPPASLSSASWEEIVDAAKGTTVTFYGWGGDEDRNNWLASVAAPYMNTMTSPWRWWA